MKKAGKWQAYAYIWNDEQTEAKYKITGANIPVSFTHGGKQHNNFTDTKSYPCMVDYTDESADLDLRAKAYLDINCGHCHSAVSPASTSGLFLTYEEEDMTKWGVYKPPVAAESTHPAVMMPEIGRVTVHEEGVTLIRQWIDEMSL